MMSEPQIVVGMNHAIFPCGIEGHLPGFRGSEGAKLTRKSTTYGAAMDPTCDIVELVPSAEFRIDVGNISAVCSVTIE